MKKSKFITKLSVALVTSGLLSFAAGAAETSDDVAGGTITFSGYVTDTTCNVTTDSGSDFTVAMTPITLSDVSTTVGLIETGATPFTINVDGCTGFDSASTTAQALMITFSSSSLSSDNTYLTNSSGSATGVGVTLTSDGTASTLVSFNSAFDTGLTTTQSAGAAYDTGAEGAITLYANYYNYGGSSVSTGTVITTATYVFSYN